MDSCRKSVVSNYANLITDLYRIGDRDRVALRELLISDPETRDKVLCGPALRRAVFEDPQICEKAPLLYLFVEIYHQLQKHGVHSVDIADCVTTFIALHMFSMSWFQKPTMTNPVAYINSLIDRLNTKPDPETAYSIHIQIGSFLLFLTGLLPDVIGSRARHGEPDLALYERIGSSHFQFANQLRTSSGINKPEPVQELAQHFHNIRQALNSVTTASMPSGM